MAKIDIKGDIISSDEQWIYDFYDIEATSPKKIQDSFKTLENNEVLEVEINSGGGDVFAGSEIYTALKNYPGEVIVNIVGLAASSASIIAMAGSKIRMSPTAQLMIHNVSSRAGGDYRDMEHMADILKNANETIVNAYVLKTGMDKETLLDLMNKETWLSPQKAKEMGFVDEIMFDTNMKLTASYSSCTIPQNIINKMQRERMESINKNPEPQLNVDEIETLKAKLNLKIKI